MRADRRVAVVIPALDEAASLVDLLPRMPRWVDLVVVADNGSSDGTSAVARACGAAVVWEEQRGYGAACSAGLALLVGRMRPRDVVVFLDADGSDDPGEMARLVDPLVAGRADLLIGARGEAPGMHPHQRLGTAAVAGLLRLAFGARVTDLGPYRAVEWNTLCALGMRDRRYGWTAEMQARALRQGLRVVEVPVGWQPGAGRSAISGTLRGSLRAGWDLTRAVLGQAVALRWDRLAAPRRRRRALA